MAAVGPVAKVAVAAAPYRVATVTRLLAKPHLRRHRRSPGQPIIRRPRATPCSTSARPRPRRCGGRARISGVVVLDFGKLAYHRHTYGTITFSGNFASNRAITWALKAYARGYSECLPRWSSARITLARGTSNQAHAALVRELARHPKTRVSALPTVTNIAAPN